MPAANATAYIHHPSCARHDPGSLHPEAPDRLRALEQRLGDSGLLGDMQLLSAPAVSRAELEAVHSATLLNRLEALSPVSGRAEVDPDTRIGPESLEAARRASGALVAAVDGVVAGQFRRAFCAVRPPGHHAERATAMGFCLFNNIAVGAAHALARGLERVAILDFDVHHGNGTVDIFRDDPQVLVCSSFQHPFYPHRLYDLQRPHIVNSPLPAGSNGEAMRAVVEEQWLPALERHRPQLLLVSAGFDAHRDDPLAGLEWTAADYAWITGRITAAADEWTDGRIIATLEGGYDLGALADSVEAHVGALLA